MSEHVFKIRGNIKKQRTNYDNKWAYCTLTDYVYGYWSACGAMVNVVGNGHGDPCSNPEWNFLHLTLR